MKSAKHDAATSGIEVVEVGASGILLSIDGQEFLLAFEHFPWFRDASANEISDIRRPTAEHLHWPRLDVDLTVDSIRRPERYPLASGGTRRGGTTDRGR